MSDTTSSPEPVQPLAVQELAEALREVERGLILVVTGAGVSVASGIPTFRGTDPGAVWKRDVTELGTVQYFNRDPVGSWSWYSAVSRAFSVPSPTRLIER